MQTPGFEHDLAAATPPPLARAAGYAQLLAGAAGVATGLQFLIAFGGLVGVPFLWRVVCWTLLVAGVAQLLLGLATMRARAWAAIAALCLGAHAVFGLGLWWVNATLSGVVSLLPPVAGVANVAAIALTALAVGPCVRATGARNRMRAQGIELGI